ncbi:MAG: HPr(Ser) kinase/phosphatase [Candidatus Hinthialibacter antarcticus]|nr:HPr(Ser) kinase/phosphatase [Candidatus Hinthialibacter antarcticus]
MTSERVMTPKPISVRRLLEFHDLDLKVAGGEEGLDRVIIRAELNRPALELSGFFDKWQPERVQILGSGEMTYIENSADKAKLSAHLERIFASHPPCVVVTNDVAATDEIVQLAARHKVTLLLSSHHSTSFIKRLWDHLNLELSPYVVKRGVMMDIFNLGVLIIGPSSIGKSECALELLSKGHTFVADDLVLIRTAHLSHLVGSGKAPVPFHMEIRGIGIIDVSRMYGPRAVRHQKQIDMVVNLEGWDAKKDYERLGIEDRATKILGIEIPIYHLPIKPGRNIGTIVEVAVLDMKLKQSGVHMAREFDERLIKIMSKVEGR